MVQFGTWRYRRNGTQRMATNEQILAAIYGRMDTTGHYEPKVYEDAFACIRAIGEDNGGEIQLGLAKYLMGRVQGVMSEPKSRTIHGFMGKQYELYKGLLRYVAPLDFDSYILYVESNRPQNRQFYLPRRKQLKPLADALQDLEERKIEILGISLPPGSGKALADDTPVLTRNGWKNHGDLVVGDEVIGMDGKFKKVIAVHDKCQLDVLAEFTNGEKIQCHENHEWPFYDRALMREVLVETKRCEAVRLDTGEPGHRKHRYRFQVPHREYIAGEEKRLPMEPYTLGVWLGDGINKTPTICNPICDVAIIDKIVSKGYEIRWKTQHKITGVWYYGFGFRSELQSVGMCHSRRATTKHIPEEYLTASVEQRLELLAGLLDTDGTLSETGRYHFSTSEPALRDGVSQLVSTFGWRVSITKQEPHTSTKLVNGNQIIGRKPTWTIGFNPDCIIPCALERKRVKEPKKQRRVALKSLTRVEPKQGNCITVEGDGTYLVGKTMLPTHNSTLAEFFLTWTGGKHPEKPILTGSHSNSFLRGMYDEINRMLDPDGEYLWNDVFPDLKVIKTNAQDMMIDLGKSKRQAKRFTTFEFSSIGSGNAGKVRAENLLYCDDLVDSLETALSRDRMEKLYNMYATDLRQRKIGNAAELHIATRWSVLDVIGRLEQLYDGNDKARFITCPALDENDESNFDYPIDAGFTTKFYHEQRDAMDDASWRALYMNQPIEREGQLYPEQELRRYFELPDGEPDAIISVVDTKDKGADYCVMPVAYQYGQDLYIEGVVCDNSAPDIVETRLTMALMKHNVQLSQFESNAAGGKIAEKVQADVKSRGGRTKIVTKWTTANKVTKILTNSPYVKEHCLFKDRSVIKGDKEYMTFMRMLTGYTMAGKNKHDDVPDAMAQLALYVQSLENKIEVFKRIW